MKNFDIPNIDAPCYTVYEESTKKTLLVMDPVAAAAVTAALSLACKNVVFSSSNILADKLQEYLAKASRNMETALAMHAQAQQKPANTTVPEPVLKIYRANLN
ncbi:MAG TPA: hypothetical protein PKB02_02590 [Anaerohalosphaeraceae bacterium]|nr:hypothetical protein [Anaerohalosphaeraceae bacterium]